MRRRCWRKPSLYPWKSEEVRICGKKGKAEHMQTNQISGLGNKEKLDQGEEVEEEVLNMAIAISLEEQL